MTSGEPATDLLGRNRALIEQAIGRLDKTRPRLRATYDGERRRFRVTADGVARVNAYVDGWPLDSLEPPFGETVALRPGAPEPATARFLGYVAAPAVVDDAPRPIVAYRWSA